MPLLEAGLRPLSGPTVSVVMPSLNSGAFIGEAVRSALEQEPSSHEVVVQDGGSTDHTLSVLGTFGSAVKFVSEPDGGQADALNRAIDRSTGDVIVWLNADDLLAPGALAAVDAAFSEHPDAAFVYGDFEVIDATGRILRRFRSSPYDPARVFTHGCYIFSGAMFLRRELIERVGPFDHRFHACMDYDFLMRIGDVRAVHVDQVLARFRVRADQKSATIRSTFLKESHAIRWRVAGDSVRKRALTLLLDLRDAAYLLTHRWRFGRVWSSLRRDRRL